MRKYFQIPDERTQALSGKIAVILLALTQTALLIAILYRRFVLGMEEESYQDLRIILFLSVFSFIGVRLYLGAVLPVFSFRIIARIYAGLVLFLLITLSLWLGLPELSNWQNTILPVFAGPAILLAGYSGLVYLGQRRIERSISSDE
jgi:hypothetical protein